MPPSENPSPRRFFDPFELAWLAGIIEGEGCIYFVNRRGWRGGIRVHMTDEDVVRRCLAVTGLGFIYAGTTPAGRPAWHWNVTRRDDCARLLLALYPLMGKRRQAKIAETAEKVCTTYRENGRGNQRRRPSLSVGA